MKKSHLIKLNHKVQVLDLGYTTARRRPRQQRGRISAAPAAQYQQRQQREHGENRAKHESPPATQTTERTPKRCACHANTSGAAATGIMFHIQTTRQETSYGTFFDWGHRAPGLTSQARARHSFSRTLKLKSEKPGCKHTATMLWALWCWVVWAGGATIFQETCYDTLKHMLVQSSYWKHLTNMSKEHVFTLAEPR